MYFGFALPYDYDYDVINNKLYDIYMYNNSMALS